MLSNPAKSTIGSGPIWKGVWVAAAFSMIIGATRGVSLGDTQVYAYDIVDHLGKSPFGYGNSLWEFGHVLWRPLGWALLSVTLPLLSTLTNWTPVMDACFVLMAISAMSSVVTVFLWYLLLMDITESLSISVMVSLGIACSHGFLLYAHSGCAYIPGLMCLTASLYALRNDKIMVGAIFYALATLLWLPFILAGVALFLVASCPADWRMRLRDSLRTVRVSRGLRFAGISAASVLFVLCLALAARRISSAREAEAWYSEAQHGWSQNMNVVRIATGLPRSFLYLGKDGILFKRYLNHDPYAPVTIVDLVKASLWKIVAFDLFAVCLIYELMNRAMSGWPLLLLLLGAGPVICFAVFIFEPGSPERYLPALPFLVVAAGMIFRDFPRKRRLTQFAIAAFLLCVVFNNISSFARPRISGQDDHTWQRIAEVRQRVNGASMVAVITNQDEITELISRSPFGEINRPSAFSVYDIVEPATLRVLQWKEQFAARALEAWDRGGEVWVSRRAWSSRPQPAWHWAEGDDKRVSWKDVPDFFSTLQTDAATSAQDGFLRLTQNNANRALLAGPAAEYRSGLSASAKRESISR